MRKVFEHPTSHEVGHYESILQSHGIATFIRNQNVSSLIGEVPFTSAYPELWVVDDEDYDAAISLLSEYRSNLPTGLTSGWTCASCKEVVPGSFSSCWNCNSSRPPVDEKAPLPGSENPVSSSAKVSAENPARAAQSPLTVTCMIIAALVFAWKFMDPEMARRIFSPASTEIYAERWDGLLGSVFMHADFTHLAFNLYWIWTFGSVLEASLRRGFWVLLFLGCAVFSAAAQLAFCGETGIGLSGAVYGLFGFMLFAKPRYPAFAVVLTRNVIMLLLGWLVLCFALTYAKVYLVANAAHVAGLVAGSVIGWLVVRSRRAPTFACGALIALAIASVMFAPWSPTFLAVRACKLMKKGQSEQASVLLSRIVQTDGTLTSWAANNLAFIRQNKGDYSGAEKVYEAALPKSEKDSAFLNGYAWLLATAPEASVRNGDKALKLALTAADLTEWKDAAVLDTLAAAYAETGDFTSAVKWQTTAVGMGLMRDAIRERLELYRQGKAFRENFRPKREH